MNRSSKIGNRIFYNPIKTVSASVGMFDNIEKAKNAIVKYILRLGIITYSVWNWKLLNCLDSVSTIREDKMGFIMPYSSWQNRKVEINHRLDSEFYLWYF